MILCVRVSVCVSAVRQNGVVDQRRVVEALHVELYSVLRRNGGKRNKMQSIKLLFSSRMLLVHFILSWDRTFKPAD